MKNPSKIILLLLTGIPFLGNAALKLELVPGYQVCSLYVTGCTAEVDYAFMSILQYRKAGEKNWRTMPPELSPVYVAREKMLRGSLFDLEEDTIYEMRLECVDKQEKATLFGKFRTRGAAVSVARTIVLDEKTKMPLHITTSGTPEGYLRYTMKKGAVLDGGTQKEFAIFLDGAHYVILDGLTVRGGRRHGILADNCENIQILNCDVSGYSRVGTHRPDLNGMYYDERNHYVSQDSGIQVRNTRRALIERNYVHDPRGTANSWFYAHPAGPNALKLGNVREATIRYNDFVGSDLHRWNDAAEGAGNSLVTGSAWRDAEVTGNNFLFTNDDGMELDGGQINARFFGNRCEGFYCGISLAPCLRGPSWCYRNLFVSTGAEFGLAGVFIKNIFGNRGVGYGRITCFNNTMVGLGGGFSAFGGNREAGKTLRFVSRRNLFSGTRSRIARVLFRESRVDFDEDLLYSTNPGVTEIPELRKRYNQEKHGIEGVPRFVAPQSGNYRLKPDSPGYREQVGAFPQENSPELPVRPIPLAVSAQHLAFQAASSTEWKPRQVTVSCTRPGTELSFQIVKNEAFPFLVVSPASGVVTPEKPAVLTVSIDPAHIRKAMKHSAAFLVRLPNGFSRVVTVYADSREDRTLLKRARTGALPPVIVKELDGKRCQIDFELKKEFHGYLFGRFAPGTSEKVELTLDGKPTDRVELRGPAEVRALPVWKVVGTRNLQGNPHFRLVPGKHRFILTLQEGKLLSAALAETPGVFLNAPYAE